VYIAAHYPADVVVDLVLGGVVAAACYAVGNRLTTRAVVSASATVVGTHLGRVMAMDS
jgi:membrane-associated phospholipid phosphatase